MYLTKTDMVTSFHNDIVTSFTMAAIQPHFRKCSRNSQNNTEMTILLFVKNPPIAVVKNFLFQPFLIKFDPKDTQNIAVLQFYRCFDRFECQNLSRLKIYFFTRN